MPRSDRGLVLLRRLGSLLILGIAAAVLWRQIGTLSERQIYLAGRDIPLSAWVASAIGTMLSFVCLAALEFVAVRRVLSMPVPARVALWVGASSHALANTLGFHAVTAALARYRGYRDFNLRAIDIGKIIGVVGGSLVGGATLLALVMLAWLQSSTTTVGGAMAWTMSVISFGLLIAVGTMRWWRSSRVAGDGYISEFVGLVLLTALEAAVAAATLFALLPTGIGLDYAHFILAFLGASLLGVASHSPGGVGVFEAAMLTALPQVDAPALLASLLAYRAIYNLGPFAVVVLALALNRRPARQIGQLEGG